MIYMGAKGRECMVKRTKSHFHIEERCYKIWWLWLL